MMIKICGITNQEDAAAAAAAGATAIGLNFYPRSPRYVSPQAAAGIGQGIGLLRVGVFVDETPGRIAEIARLAALDVVQLHGSESPHSGWAAMRVWKAFRVAADWTPEATEPFDVEAVLLDGPDPGNGCTFDWSKARGVRQNLILAGGLNDANVAEAIRLVRPWGVDACSGVEKSPGIKDHRKILRFVRAAQSDTL